VLHSGDLLDAGAQVGLHADLDIGGDILHTSSCA
jgi:hypothetical protein